MPAIPALVMGTAGHVDHGKTSLVNALTGVDLDTLSEEKARGLTINLGFTHFDTPSGIRVGIVDVPGHKRFIKTMLAGAHGIDFVLFLVAADDSVMPQTREHLHILRLLGVDKGIKVITKTDLMDEELIELVEEEVEELVSGTFLEDAPVIRFSSVTGEGLERLKKQIDELAKGIKPRERGTYFRMFVDRSFTLAGAGTVVTGTPWSGGVSPGDELEVLPEGGRARARNIEIHGEQAERARAGQRTAINLRMLDRTEVKRGNMLATPGMVRPTYMVDAGIEVLEDFPRPVPHWSRVRFYIGTHESFGRLVLLEENQVSPGQAGYVQLRLESPAPAAVGDPFILRDFSAERTMGGGTILDPHPVKHKRKKALVVEDLKRRESGYLEEVFELEVRKAGYFIKRSRVARELDVEMDKAGQAAAGLAEKGKIILMVPERATHIARYVGERSDPGPWVIHREAWDRLVSRAMQILKEHHQSLPQLDTGLSEQELRERTARAAGTDLPEEPFHNALERLKAHRVLREVEGTYALSEHTASLGADDQAALARIRAQYSESPMAPPSTSEALDGSDLPKQVIREFLDRLVREGELLRVSREFLFEKKAVEEAKQGLLDYLEKNETITVSRFREIAGTSRKYAVPLLNYFDNQGVTVRQGEIRRKGPKAVKNPPDP